MSQSSTFIDGFDNVTFVDGVVRLDLITVAPGAPNTQPVATKVGAVAMPIQGFLRATDQLNQVIAKMVEQGILKRNEPASVEAPMVEAPAK
ncbi:MAG: hypothetical protein QE283_11240 [Rhodoferax sp.]|nr:hypothetical protein [Rhodoferax sp.]